MLEDIVAYMSTLSPSWIYLTLFFFSFIENVFPPSPSDVVVVFGATLISHGDGEISFVLVLLITSFGSSIGFLLMYYVGKLFGETVIRKGKLKFISRESIDKTDKWFSRYGYKLILANRFMPGTRSVISFFSGFTELEIKKTFIFATISAFAWNLIIIYLGVALGNNIKLIDYYLSTYQEIVLIITAVIIVVFLIRHFFFRKKKS
jgi:membrane protein DedA with SNARE-associated domain